MYTRWTQHLTDPEEKERFRNQVISAKPVLERLIEMIDEDEQALDRTEIDPRSYSVPNWSELQAHKNGNRQVYAVIKKMIDLDHQNIERNKD